MTASAPDEHVVPALAPQGDTPAFSLFDEASSFLLWLSKRWPALGVAGLIMAMLLWIDFIRFFDLPVSFISPSMLSALPILGLAVGVPIVAATLFVALMAFVLWQPLHEGAPSVVSWASAPGDAEGAGQDGRPDVFVRWIVLCVVHALYWVMYVALVMLHVKASGHWVWLLGLLLPEAFGFYIFWPVFRAASRRRPSWRYLLLFGVAIAMQTVLAGLLFIPVLGSAQGTVNTVLHLEGFFFIVVGIGFVQLVTAKLVMRGWRRGLTKKVFLSTTGLMVMLVAFPDIGGQVASYRLALTGPGHSACMVLVFRDGQSVTDTIARSLIADVATRHSVPFAFTVRLDDQYYVKERAQAGQTWVIPVASVAGFDACPTPPKP
jgi:hypothetical protein